MSTSSTNLFAVTPLFDNALVAQAYLLRCSDPGAPLLELFAGNDLDRIVTGKPLLVSFTDGELDSEGLAQCDVRRLVPILRSDESEERIARLKGLGFSLALRSPLAPPEGVSYWLLEGRELPAQLPRTRGLQAAAVGLTDWDGVNRARQLGFQLLEGPFYFVPEIWEETEDSANADSTISPLKTNLIRLINTVRDESCDFQALSKLVRQDPALTVSLMRLVNSPYIGVRNRVKSIPQAVTLLGQVEVRKWVATAVFKYLGSDRPDELTRGSLLRAKFAENLAPLTGLRAVSDSVFLLGLFSALDGILGIPMEKAVEMVPMDEELVSALLRGEGPFAPVLKLALAYDRADWEAVHASCEAQGLQEPDVLNAYREALAWYGTALG